MRTLHIFSDHDYYAILYCLQCHGQFLDLWIYSSYWRRLLFDQEIHIIKKVEDSQLVRLEGSQVWVVEAVKKLLFSTNELILKGL